MIPNIFLVNVSSTLCLSWHVIPSDFQRALRSKGVGDTGFLKSFFFWHFPFELPLTLHSRGTFNYSFLC